MFKILNVETTKYIKSPSLLGYFLSPLIYFALIYVLIGPAVALTFTIFVQTLFMALFVYGTKIKDYSNDTMKKKMNNSKLSMWQVYLVQYFLSNIILVISLLIPLLVVVIKVESLSHFEANQYSIWSQYSNFSDDWLTWDSIAQENFINTYNNGIWGPSTNLLLFNSFQADNGVALFFNWVFALFVVNVSLYSFAHVLTTVLKDSSRYFSLSLSLFILIILFSSITTKDIVVLNNSDAYGRMIPVIKNKTLNSLKIINPFYWINQLLMNATIADWASGDFTFANEFEELPNIINPDLGGVSAPGIYQASYFNIFHIGTDVESIGTIDNLNRTAYFEMVELWQILALLSPILFSVTCISISIMQEVM